MNKETYLDKVENLINEGLTRSDAQSVVDIEERDEEIQAAQTKLLRYALLALADLDDQKTGWYYQLSAAAEKVENLTANH